MSVNPVQNAHGPEVTALLCLCALTTAAALLLGPVPVLIIGGVVAIGKFFGAGWRVSLCALTVGASLLTLFGRNFDHPWWQRRFNLLGELLSADRSFVDWITDLQITIESVSCGLILGGTIWLAGELARLSPLRRLSQRQRREQHGKQSRRRVRQALARINAAPASPDPAATILGVEARSGRAIRVPDTSLNTHMLIIGTTGSGKTVSLLNFVESFIDCGLPVIFIDGKGDPDLARQIRDYAAHKGRKHWLFSMTGPSCRYNPLTGDHTTLKDRIIGLRLNWSEEHYLKLAEGYLQMVFKVLQATGQNVSIGTIARQFGIGALMTAVRQSAQSGVLSPDAARILIREIEEQQEAAKHVESLRAELSNLARSSLGPLFETDRSAPSDACLELRNVIARNGVAFIGLAPLIYPEVSGVIGRLVLNDLKASLDPHTPRKVLLVIDEITTLISPSVLNFLNQGRYLGLHIILTAQSVADLGQKIQTNADLFIRQILSNCNVFVIHKVNDHDDAEQLATMLGTSLEIDYTAQIADFGFETGLGSARLVHEFVAHPDHIRSLRRGEGFLLDKNSEARVIGFLGRKGRLVP